ncbi:SRD-4 protein [Aphelenchoides avenae]|nr:SRD-4 protein [Aphelenchus avenae]
MDSGKLESLATINGTGIFSTVLHYQTFGPAFFYVCWGCFLFGAILNVLLMLTIIQSPFKRIKPFSRLLLQTCFLDIYTVTLSVIKPVYIIVGGTIIILQTGPLRGIEQPWNAILFEMWNFGYFFSIISIVIQFIYRYFAICRRYAAIVLVGMLVVGPSIGLQIATVTLTNVIPEKYVPEIEAFFVYGPLERTHVGVYASDPFYCTLMCIYTTTVEIICYLTIIVCSILIKRFVRSIAHDSTNANTIETDRQLTLTLTVLACLPLVALIFGNCCLVLCSIVKSADYPKTVFFVSHFTSIVPIVPVLNPIVTLLVIKPYRNYVSRASSSFRVSFQTAPSA